jgi:hypothetical protein
MLDRIARARARARARADADRGHAAGFPWLVTDMDATLVNARSDKEGAAPAWKKGYGRSTAAE